MDGFAKQHYSRFNDRVFEWTANYTNRWADHSLNAVAGYSYQDFNEQGFSAENSNFPVDGIAENDMGTGTYLPDGRAGIGSWKNPWVKLAAFFGRVNYSYLDRYILTATARYEGSSKFAPKNRWGFFPGLSAGWRISQEPFLKDVTFINDLKLRAGYGETGNEGFDAKVATRMYSADTWFLQDALLLSGCTKLDQEFYSSVTPDTFFKSEKDIKAALFRPFTHAKWYMGEDRWRLQEYTADNFAITTKGRHWYNGGENERYHYHRWTADDSWVWGSWRGTLMGVALALDTKSDLSKLDYGKFALSEERKAADLAQLDALIAYFYLRGLDYFGGMPIFESLDQESLPRNTDQELFAHIEKLLKAAIENLPAKKAGDNEEGAIRKAAAAAMLAQLYFNAEAYIGKAMYAESQKLAQDIVNKVYGDYALDTKWNGVHGFKNNESPEIIWSMPSEFKMLEYNWFYADFYHYNTKQFFAQDMGGNNGAHLTPSRKPNGSLYTTDFKLGSPFETFDQGDLRKAPYVYHSTDQYEGMFIVGPHKTPSGEAILGGEEYKDKPLNFVDQVGRFSEVGSGKKYSSIDQLPSKMSEGEENTGVRLVKVPIPNLANNTLRWGADMPIIRLAEVYYMLAECDFRLGNKEKAAELFNTVRKRNFANAADPNPVNSANMDKYRILDEWSIEFLGEGRRRTDLIRWKAFTTEKWWDHNPSTSAHLNRFPVPNQAIAGNSNLAQNPGY